MRLTIHRHILAAACLLCTASALAQTAGGGHELIEVHSRQGNGQEVTYFSKASVRSITFEYHSQLEELGFSSDTILMTASTERPMYYGDMLSTSKVTFETDVDWLIVKVVEDSLRASYSLQPYEEVWLPYADINTSRDSRQGTVTAYNEEGDTLRFTVVQQGYCMTLGSHYDRVEEADVFKADTVYGEWNYLYWYVSVTPNHSWKVESCPDWLTLDSLSTPYTHEDFEAFKQQPFSWQWGGSQSVYFYSQPNTTGQTLEGDIVISGLYGEILTLHVVQPPFTDDSALDWLRNLQRLMYDGYVYDSSNPTDYSYMSVRHMFDRMTGDVVPMQQTGFDWYASLSELSVQSNYIVSIVAWYSYYNIIRGANDILNKLDTFDGEISCASFIRGNALAYRAMALMELLQAFQNMYDAEGNEDFYDNAFDMPGVPILLSDKELAAFDSTEVAYLKSRNNVETTVEMMANDMLEAIELLKGQERPDKNFIDIHVLYGLIARAALMIQSYDEAAAYASMALTADDDIFPYDSMSYDFNELDNSDYIWGYREEGPVTSYGNFFGWMSNAPADSYGRLVGIAFNDRIVGNIAADDARMPWANDSTGYSGSAFPGNDYDGIPYIAWKFQPKNYWEISNNPYGEMPFGDYIYMRKAEMELIVLEATTHDYVHARRGDAAVQAALEPILRDRELELIGEGHSLFDHKRTGRPVLRGSNDPYLPNERIEANDWRLTLPIPARAFNDPLFNLVPEDQNPGYDQ